MLSRCLSSQSLDALLAHGTLETLLMASSWLTWGDDGSRGQCTGTGPCQLTDAALLRVVDPNSRLGPH